MSGLPVLRASSARSRSPRSFERQDGDKALPGRRRGVKPGLACHREHAVGVVAQHPLDIVGRRQAGNGQAGLGHQIFDRRLVRPEQHQMLGDPAGVQFVQSVLAVPVGDAILVWDQSHT